MGFTITNKTDFNIEKSIYQFNKFTGNNNLLPKLEIEFLPENKKFNSQKPVSCINNYNFYSTDNGYLFSLEGIFLRLNCDFTHAEVYCPDDMSDSQQFYISYILMLAYKYTVIANGEFIIHASTSVFGSDCICFCGLSGAGKSTQTSLWEKHLKTWSVNYDQPCILNRDGRYLVHGSPWSGKEHLFRNCFSPLKAIVFVQQSPVNSVERLTKAEAFSLLYLNNYVYPISEKCEQKYTENIYSAIEHIPVYRLNCTISETAVEVLYKELYGNDYYKEKKVVNMTYSAKTCFEMKNIAGDFLLIPRGSGAIDYSAVLVLNETGAFLWREMRTPVTVSELVKKLVDKFAPSAEQARADVEKFIEKMRENELIDVHE
ncbi:MAG: PqqD family protein [Clostridiales bacterium]|nr:PqqD family protein [Clostridiales bacterium]